MAARSIESRKLALPTAVTAAASVLVLSLAVAGFLVARVATRDQLTALGLQGAVLLANEIRSRRPHWPESIPSIIASFETDGVKAVSLIGPDRRPIAGPLAGKDLSQDALLYKAFNTGDVQVGWADDNATFCVYVPVDRIPGPRWRKRPFPPFMAEPPPLPAPAQDPLWPGTEGRIVLVMHVEPDIALWLRRWACAQALICTFAVGVIWIAWFYARRSAVAIAALEVQRQRRENLARLGEMAAVLAHEIRNPLASLKGHLQLAQEATSAESPAALKPRLTHALDSVARIESLVRDLLDYSRDAPLKIEELQASTLINYAIQLAGPAMHHLTLEVHAPSGTTLRADSEQMGRALANIMQNAAEAAGPQGKVKVTVRDLRVLYSVVIEDSGPGLPADLGRRIFDPFVTTKTKGTGLGLAVAQKIVEMHQGRIETGKSADLGGARVEVLWPKNIGAAYETRSDY